MLLGYALGSPSRVFLNFASCLSHLSDLSPLKPPEPKLCLSSSFRGRSGTPRTLRQMGYSWLSAINAAIWVQIGHSLISMGILKKLKNGLKREVLMLSLKNINIRYIILKWGILCSDKLFPKIPVCWVGQLSRLDNPDRHRENTITTRWKLVTPGISLQETPLFKGKTPCFPVKSTIWGMHWNLDIAWSFPWNTPVKFLAGCL